MDIRNVAPFVAVAAGVVQDHFPMLAPICIGIMCFVCGMAVQKAWTEKLDL